MSKPKQKINVRRLIDKMGYKRAMRKMRIYGFTKIELARITEPLFSEITEGKLTAKT